MMKQILSASSVVLVGLISFGAISPNAPTEKDKPVILGNHEATIMAVASSPDGKVIASGGVDGKVRLWPVPVK